MVSIKTQFSVFLVNKPGVLATVTAALADAGVNVTALAMMDAVENGVLRFICDQADRAREVLNSTDHHWTETQVLVIEMENQPGAIAKVAQVMAKAHISVAYAYITGGVGDGRTSAVFKMADTARAYKILAEKFGSQTPPESGD